MRTILASLLTLVLLLAAGPAAAGQAQDDAPPERLRVMSFNIWVGGEGGEQPLEQTAAAIRAAGADVVGLQESLGREVDGQRPDNAQGLAEALGWQVQSDGKSPAILSRHRIIEPTAGGHGALIETESGRRVLVFNVHLNHMPYQPYQLLEIPYGNGRFITTAAEAVAEAKAARGKEVAALLPDIEQASQKHPDVPIFVTGDFNEPSHQDWTPAAAEAGLCPLAVEWPTTKALTEAGFVDTWRHCHPDVAAAPGRTWTPITRPDDPKDRHDRIDFVFLRLPAATSDQTDRFAIESSQVVGESPETSDVVLTPWPSDHRAVVTTLRFGPGDAEDWSNPRDRSAASTPR